MAAIRLSIEATTKATIAITVDTTHVGLDSHLRGTVQIDRDKEALLSWVVAGTPSEPYTIEMKAPVGHKVEAMTGANPVKSRISTRLFRGAGHIRFRVVKEVTP